jgi:type II secretory pathway component PulF
MTYPVAIAFFAMAIMIGLMKGVMPQIIPVLTSLRVQLPLLTRAVMAVSMIVSKYGLYITIAIAASLTLLILSYRRIEKFKYFCQSFLLRLPIAGPLIRAYFISVFALSLGSLVDRGMSVAAAYSKTVSNITFLPLKQACARNEADVSKGIALSQVLSKIRLFPRFVHSMTRAGESAGSLGRSLMHSASILDRDIEHSLKRLTALLEPVMMAGMGIVVGAVALSIVMPIYDVSKVLGK